MGTRRRGVIHLVKLRSGGKVGKSFARRFSTPNTTGSPTREDCVRDFPLLQTLQIATRATLSGLGRWDTRGQTPRDLQMQSRLHAWGGLHGVGAGAGSPGTPTVSLQQEGAGVSLPLQGAFVHLQQAFVLGGTCSPIRRQALSALPYFRYPFTGQDWEGEKPD